VRRCVRATAKGVPRSVFLVTETVQLAFRTQPLTRADVLTAREVGDLLRLPPSTVYELARRGLIPAHRVGRAWRFIRQEIQEWLIAN
jgi:excisionase family DNA binding protein